MQPLIQELLSGAPVILDGGWGTLLQTHGLTAGDCPDGWNVSHPDIVQSVASLYVEAGSALILTNTFRANRIALEQHGLEGKIQEINRAGVAVSRAAAGERAKVFASIGPSGKMLMAGDVTEEDIAEVFREQAQLLAEAGADALVVETMSDITEATIALGAARSTGLPVIACMVFDSGKERDRTMMGSTPEQVAEELTKAGADVVGANCGVGIDSYVPVCARLKAATDRPIWIKPNAGLPEIVGGNAVYTTSPEEFAQHGPALRDSGASFIGGCCGTTPEFIRALRQSLAANPAT
jgi:methionine synthase I (cobalamin-dependent)